MKKKKNKPAPGELDTELLRLYMTGGANPSTHNKYQAFTDDVVDLHMQQSAVGKGKIPANEVLFHQLEQFERAIDKAIASGKLEIRIVHGHGKGKLKQELYKLLKKHPQVKSFENDYHSRYGFGSTIIHFY